MLALVTLVAVAAVGASFTPGAGSAGGGTESAGAPRAAAAGGTIYDYAVVSKRDLSITGAVVVDSGTTPPWTTTPPTGTSGNVHSEANLSLSGAGVVVNGRAEAVGSASVTGGATVSQGSFSNAASLPLPPVDAAGLKSAAAQIGTTGGIKLTGNRSASVKGLVSGDVSISGKGSLRIDGLTYVTGNITFSGNGSATLAGGAVLVVDGTLTLPSGTSMTSAGTSTATVISTASNRIGIRLSGACRAAAHLYAPDGEINLNAGPAVFGTIAAAQVTLAGNLTLRRNGESAPPPPPPPPPPPTGPLPLPEERYATGSPIALGVWLTNPEALGFASAHVANAMGIPVVVTRDLAAALKQPMLIVEGELGGAQASAGLITAFQNYVTNGGTLVLTDGQARAVQVLAGVQTVAFSSNRYAITFDTATKNPGFVRITEPESTTISIGNAASGQAINSNGMFLDPAAGGQVLATYDDGSAALVERRIGAGRVILFGSSLQDLILRPQNNRDYEAQRYYDDHFEPSADVPQIILRDWYLSYVPGSVAVSPVPDGMQGALILTHDLDWGFSYPNSLQFAAAEKAMGVAGTYFLQTKIVQDWMDNAFWDDNAKAIAAQLAANGMEIASHSVAHAHDWPNFPRGDGTEDKSSYFPYVESATFTRGGTVIGEIKVSKQLIEEAIPSKTVNTYRSGYLYYNPNQWLVLAEQGYRYDSSETADDVLTCFPYRMMDQRGFSRETPIWEFPLVLADAHLPMMDNLDLYKSTLDKYATLQGVCPWLVHPNVVADKLDAQIAIMNYVRGRFWVGGLQSFARYWEARENVTVRGSVDARTGTETITVSSPKDITGITLNFTPTSHLEGASAAEAAAKGGKRRPRLLVIPKLKGGKKYTIKLPLR